MQLRWQSASQAAQVVPKARLFSAAAEVSGGPFTLDVV